MAKSLSLRILSTLAFLVFTFFPLICLAAPHLLVDFGGESSQNTYNNTDFPDWNRVNLSSHTNYATTGPGGLTMVSGTEVYDGWQSISGPAMAFHPGDTIIVTWFNGTGDTISRWRPLISFTDTDAPSNTEGTPQWYAMANYGSSLTGGSNVNYFYDQQSVQTQYTITTPETSPGEAPASEGSHSIINVCYRGDERFRGLVLDKIEVVRAAESTPNVPAGLVASPDPDLPYARVGLAWGAVAPAGDIPIDHYRVYRNGIWVGKSDTTTFIDANLETQTTYNYSVEAVNIFQIHSGHASQVTARTAPFPQNTGRLNPEKIKYLGAFRFPSDTTGSSWNYRRGQMAYYALGDADNIDGDRDFPGSLYATGHTYDKMAAEISIPRPVVSRDVENLPLAKTLQHFHQIEPDNSYPSNYVSVGLVYLEEHRRFYSTFYYWYNVSFNKLITHGAFPPDFSDIYGSWWVGRQDEPRNPHYDTYAKFLAEIPNQWAAENTPDHLLLSGGQRGGSSPDGPGLVAIKPCGTNIQDIPAPGSELSFTTLLAYKNDGVDTMNGWIETDYFDGVAWVQGGAAGSAVVFAGSKAYGEYYYGFRDGTVYHELIANVPVPEVNTIGDKGGRGRSFRAMFLFYDPDDLARVAKSQRGIYAPDNPLYMEPHEPQPYAAVDFDDYLLKPNPGDPSGGGRVESLTYDRRRGYLYLAEASVMDPDLDIIHVFDIGVTATTPAPPDNLIVVDTSG